DPLQQAPHRKIACGTAFVGTQAFCDELHVAPKLLRRLISVWPPIVGKAQALADLSEKYAVWHPVVARGSRPRARQQASVFVYSLRQRGRYGDTARALREPLSELLAFSEIGVDDHLLLAGKRLANRFRMHVGVAVHVAADPRAEAQHDRKLHRIGRHAIELLER